MGKIWPFFLVVCLLTVPKISSGEILPEGKIAVITEQAATVLEGLSARLGSDPKLTMTWPCNESRPNGTVSAVKGRSCRSFPQQEEPL